MKMMALAAIVIVATMGPQQPSGTTGSRTGAIAGTLVTDDGAAAPVRRAHVNATDLSSGQRQTTITDDLGHFEFVALPAGDYELNAVKVAYVPVNFGAKRPGAPGTPIHVAAGQTAAGLTLRMLHGAVIEGTARNSWAQPAPGWPVVIRQSRRVDGIPTWTVIPSDGDSRTDDQGHYRVFGLPPGDYVVAVTPLNPRPTEALQNVATVDVARASALASGTPPPSSPSAPATVGFAPVFYPGTPVAAEATPVHVGPGEERTGVDVVVGPVPMSAVDLTLTGDGVQQVRISATLTELGPGLAPWRRIALLPLGEVGRFRAPAVLPGRYRVTAEGWGLGVASSVPNRTPQAWWASREIRVGSDGLSVTLTLEAEPRLSGRAIFEGTSARLTDTSQNKVGLVGEDTEYSSSIGADGVFGWGAIRPGTYRLTGPTLTGTPSRGPWTLQRVMLRGVDVTDRPLDIHSGQDITDLAITFDDRPTELLGTLTDATGLAASDYFVIVFPRDRTRWTPQSRWIGVTRPATDGHFTVTGLPAGSYLLAALTDVDSGDWFNPGFLESLVSSAVPIELAQGQRSTQHLAIK